jgi:exodeoxyribonuclease VII small subunit
MPEESYGFAQTRVRLEEIVAQVRKKDVSLEKSLDLLEEGVRLANQCTELIDRADWEAAAAPAEVADLSDDNAPPAAGAGDQAMADEDASGEDAEHERTDIE